MRDSNDRHLRPPIVLVADDQEWSARSLESILAPNGFAVLHAYTGRQAIELARRTEPDAVILDMRMTDLDGTDVCRELRADPRIGDHTPILITTSGPPERLEAVAAFEAGAWDYFGHPLDGELLILKLGSYVRAKREVDRERDESLIDGATGLYNMRGLARRAREIAAGANRQRAPLSCVAVAPAPPEHMDERAMDELTNRLAAHLGQTLRSSSRSSDVVGRLGQAEFAIIAPATDGNGAMRLVERLRQMLASATGEADMPSLQLLASYCTAQDYAESTVDAVEMMLRAAAALRDLRSDQGNAQSRDPEGDVRYVH